MFRIQGKKIFKKSVGVKSGTTGTTTSENSLKSIITNYISTKYNIRSLTYFDNFGTTFAQLGTTESSKVVQSCPFFEVGQPYNTLTNRYLSPKVVGLSRLSRFWDSDEILLIFSPRFSLFFDLLQKFCDQNLKFVTSKKIIYE